MEREAISPGITGEKMNEGESSEGKEAGKDKPSTSEDQGKNIDSVRHETPASEEENADQLVTSRKSTTFQMSPLSVPVSSGCSDSLVDQADFQRPSNSSAADMDCLVCFNQYSCSRPPKMLACQHVFCAVCLKLMLRNEHNAWRIVCPLCRKVTTIFGGLICSLPDKVGIGPLGDPGPNVEMPFSPNALSGTLVIHSTFSMGQGEEHSSWVAVKRLLFLLLLLVVLIIFILPFVYGDLLKWVLCFAGAFALIGAGVLCCNPNWC